MVESKLCSRCGGIWTPDVNDIRPFLYHECSDGVMMAHNNPNFFNGRWSSPKGVSERNKEQRYDYKRNTAYR